MATPNAKIVQKIAAPTHVRTPRVDVHVPARNGGPHQVVPFAVRKDGHDMVGNVIGSKSMIAETPTKIGDDHETDDSSENNDEINNDSSEEDVDQPSTNSLEPPKPVDKSADPSLISNPSEEIKLKKWKQRQRQRVNRARGRREAREKRQREEEHARKEEDMNRKRREKAAFDEGQRLANARWACEQKRRVCAWSVQLKHLNTLHTETEKIAAHERYHRKLHHEEILALHTSIADAAQREDKLIRQRDEAEEKLEAMVQCNEVREMYKRFELDMVKDLERVHEVENKITESLTFE